MLRGYGELEDLDKELTIVLGQEAHKELVPYMIDKKHVPVFGHLDYVRQTTRRDNRQLWKVFSTAEERYWIRGIHRRIISAQTYRP